MDSSPRPQRRFSRWQTTKRTFVLAGVAYKPTDTNTVRQDDNEKSGSVRKSKKDNHNKNDKSDRSILNHSTTDSVTKQRHHNSPLVAKSSVVRRLCLDTSRRKDSKTNINPTKATPPAHEAANGAVFSECFVRKEENVPRSSSSERTETCENNVRVDPPVLQEARLQLERVDLRNDDCHEDAVQQNNKCALSNISQNKSADTSSQTATEDKSSAVHTLPSQKIVNVTLNSTSEGVPEASAITNEASKRKRQAADDDKSSDGSSTDKENVEKDSEGVPEANAITNEANKRKRQAADDDKSSDSSSTDKENVEKDSASVPSQSKKVKKDAVLQNMPSAKKNVTFNDLNISQKNKNDMKTSQEVELSARRSSLRNRSLLASPQTLMKKRQYPVFHVAEKKIVPEKNVSKVNNVSCVEMGSLNRKGAKKTLLPERELSKGKNASRETVNKTPLPELELSKVKDTSIMNLGTSFNRRTGSKLGSPELEVSKVKDISSVNIGSSLSKKDQSKKLSTIKNVQKNNSLHQKKQSKDRSVNSSRDLTTPIDNTRIHNVHSEDIDSFSSKRGLRDRRMLPTPEEVQRQRQYPLKFFLTNRRSSIEKSDSDSKQKRVENRDTSSQLEQVEVSTASTKEITKGNSLKHKNVPSARSKSRHKSKICSSPLQHTSLGSPEISKQPTPQTGNLCNMSTEKEVGAKNVQFSAKTKVVINSVEKEIDSLSVRSVHSEDSVSFCAKSRLRDRSLLPTPEQVQKQRQYPIKYLLTNKKSGVGKSSSDSKIEVSVKKQQKTGQNREASSQLEQLEPSSASVKKIKGKSLSNKNETNEASLKRGPETKKSSSSLQDSLPGSHETLMQLVKQREAVIGLESIHNASVQKSGAAKNIGLSAQTIIEDNHIKKTDSLSVTSVHSEETDSFSSKRGLRDRSILPTAEEMQRQRQYPIEFFITNRRSSVGKSDSHNKHVSVTKQQENVVRNRETSAQLEHTEYLSMSAKTIKEKSLKRNKDETNARSKFQPERKKCSPLLQHTSFSSSEAFEPPSSHRESAHKVLTQKPVSVENIGDNAKDRSGVNCVEKINHKPSTFNIMKKNGLRVADHATTIQTTLNLIKTVSTANGAPLPSQEPAHKTQKVLEKDGLEEGVKNNRTSILNKKPLSKTDRRQYSLPRRPVRKSSKGSEFVDSVEKSHTSIVETDLCDESFQQSTTVVDTTWRKPQKLVSKKQPVQQKSNTSTNERQPVVQKHADVNRPGVSVNETVLVPTKVPRKRKLLEELDKAEGSSTQRSNEAESQHVTERSEDGRTRKPSSLSAFDVIVQAVRDTEDKLLAETEDDAFGHRLVRKVMGALKKKMKPLILDVEELKNLQHEIRQKNSKIRKLSAEIQEQQQLKAQLSKEVHSGVGSDKDLELINVSETMKGYARLMQAFTNKSK